ncbi:NUDIX domain-containing protein [Streptomyces sp. enrichment culture]|uniref:NUDIX domain-containing protein n=1 Tax=Streptomyces sp. enrichment culture TaxID=1795815 RepID=UPI003F5673F0
MPGGGVEDGELLHEALRHELREETGLRVGDPVRTASLMHIDSEQYPSAIGRRLRDRRVGRGPHTAGRRHRTSRLLRPARRPGTAW